jgi:hypothetical protein
MWLVAAQDPYQTKEVSPRMPTSLGFLAPERIRTVRCASPWMGSHSYVPPCSTAPVPVQLSEIVRSWIPTRSGTTARSARSVADPRQGGALDSSGDCCIQRNGKAMARIIRRSRAQLRGAALCSLKHGLGNALLMPDAAARRRGA